MVAESLSSLTFLSNNDAPDITLANPLFSLFQTTPSAPPPPAESAETGDESTDNGTTSSGNRNNASVIDFEPFFNTRIALLEGARARSENLGTLVEAAQDGLNAIESALEQIAANAEQAQSTSLTDQARDGLQLETERLLARIETIAQNTQVAGLELLNGGLLASDFEQPISITFTFPPTGPEATVDTQTVSGSGTGFNFNLTENPFTSANEILEIADVSTDGLFGSVALDLSTPLDAVGAAALTERALEIVRNEQAAIDALASSVRQAITGFDDSIALTAAARDEITNLESPDVTRQNLIERSQQELRITVQAYEDIAERTLVDQVIPLIQPLNNEAQGNSASTQNAQQLATERSTPTTSISPNNTAPGFANPSLNAPA